MPPPRSTRRTPLEREVAAVMRSILDLPPRGQLLVHEQLRDYLGAGTGVETAADAQIRAQNKSLDALRAVAEHLGLPEGQAPNTTQFTAGAAAAGVKMSVSTVSKPFSRYRFAVDVYEGRRPPESMSQRGQRNRTIGRRRNAQADFAGLRLWWNHEDRVLDTQREYDAFVREFNDDVTAGRSDEQPLAPGAAVCMNTGFVWAEILEVLRNGKDPDEFLAEYRKRLVETPLNALGIVDTKTAAAMLELRPQELRNRRIKGELPLVRVLVIGTNNGYLAQDVIACRDGQTATIPARQENEMRPLIMDAHEVAEAVGLALITVRHRNRIDHNYTTPAPIAYLGNALYWSRAHVEQWVKEHATLIATRKARLTAQRATRAQET